MLPEIFFRVGKWKNVSSVWIGVETNIFRHETLPQPLVPVSRHLNAEAGEYEEDTLEAQRAGCA